MILVRARYGGSALSFLLAGGFWGGGRLAVPGCRGASCGPAFSRRAFGARLELRSRLSGPEQRTGRNPALGGRVEHTTGPQRSVSTRPAERSPLSAGLRWLA